jgi:hypothetical protein
LEGENILPEFISFLDKNVVQKPAMSEGPTPTSVAPLNIKDTVEIIGKVALGVVGLSYAVGVFVVSVHLAEYGVVSLSLLRLSYIFAGILALPASLTMTSKARLQGE